MCHGAAGGDSASLIGRVRLHLNNAEGRLVNRLDRETSGVVLIAKTAVDAGELGKLFAGAGTVEKRYWAIVHRHVTESPATIDAPLGRDEASAVAIKDTVRRDGAPARTGIEVLRLLVRDGHQFAWLDIAPETGRKHQIRIHLAHIGHPIVGDKIYGGDEQIYLRFVTRCMTSDDERTLLVENHLLHARLLAFEWRGRRWRFEAPAGHPWPGWVD